MKTIFKLKPLNTDLAALLLRLILGGMFIYVGWMKIDAYNEILPIFGDIIGIGAKLSFHLVIFAEFGCGILVTLGVFTRLTVIPIFIVMFVAYFFAHANDTFIMKQLPFVYLLLCIVVFTLGSGRFSVDGLIFRNRA
ncbi:MAG TPA: DoxX family protein [Bacteroidia bacterium]|nr:DoxX family protein [Bacteroidia bacterium]